MPKLSSNTSMRVSTGPFSAVTWVRVTAVYQRGCSAVASIEPRGVPGPRCWATPPGVVQVTSPLTIRETKPAGSPAFHSVVPGSGRTSVNPRDSSASALMLARRKGEEVRMKKMRSTRSSSRGRAIPGSGVMGTCAHGFGWRAMMLMSWRAMSRRTWCMIPKLSSRISNTASASTSRARVSASARTDSPRASRPRMAKPPTTPPARLWPMVLPPRLTCRFPSSTA
jgi:hypothetical protein